jgi:4-hydroxy 2-oxovalerate aldolase
VLYLADSNGSLGPDEVAELVTVTKSVIAGEVGLHAHNNLGLALSNAIRAAEAGAGWIDAAVLGMGKGPGNLIAEQWLAHLERQGWEAGRFDLGAALELADLLLASIEEAKPGLPLPDLVLGHFDLSVEHRGSLIGGHRETIDVARALSAAR